MGVQSNLQIVIIIPLLKTLARQLWLQQSSNHHTEKKKKKKTQLSFLWCDTESASEGENFNKNLVSVHGLRIHRGRIIIPILSTK